MGQEFLGDVADYIGLPWEELVYVFLLELSFLLFFKVKQPFDRLFEDIRVDASELIRALPQEVLCEDLMEAK